MKRELIVPLMIVGMAICDSASAQSSRAASTSRPATGLRPADGNEFEQVRRKGSVDIEKEYDLTGLTIPKDQIHTLLPRDAISALTGPKTEPVEKADWLPGDARVIEVVVNDAVVGVPLRVLDWHEVVNMTVGGEPIAVTYCPLCDSATVFSRRIRSKSGRDPIVLEFGVSGALYNSNVLMYDKKYKGLWSQLGMRAVSGPHSGTALDMLPVRVVTFDAFKKAHPTAELVSKDTGHQRDYAKSPYETYFKEESLMVPVAGIGGALPRKTLGVGIAVGEGDTASAWFVPANAIADGYTIETPQGKVKLARSSAGVSVVEAPRGVRTAQTFYYSWSAFYPKTRVIKSNDTTPATQLSAPGLSVGNKAPDVAVTGINGKTVQLSSLYKDTPIVLTFYRGGWCPICNRALSAWAGKIDALKAAGGKLVALTPEKPDLAVRTREKAHADYLVFSDGAFEAAKAFKVHFVVDDSTKAKYEKFGFKVAESNVSGTWELPAPATFVIDRDGVIRYAFADWDYTKRADPDEVIAAVRSLKR